MTKIKNRITTDMKDAMINRDQELLDANLGYLEERFCDSSEFEVTTWAQKHGCSSGN